MSYITNAMIEQRLGHAAYVQLGDDDGDGVADTPVVDEVRLAAEGEVNSRLALRYAVPIDTTGRPELAGLLASITLDIAEYRLRVRRPPVPEAAERLYAQAVAWLTDVAKGAFSLPVGGLPGPNATGDISASLGEERIFTREELDGF
ncbi:MAG: DUF1320 family protein [Phycisphaerae bacterium]|nr:DUF1320 family protein [Phycisphaerae bacterium]